MAAGVVKALERAVIVAHQQHPLIAEFEGAEGTPGGQFRRATHIDPISIPDSLQLALEVARLEIRFRRQPLGKFRQAVVACGLVLRCDQYRLPPFDQTLIFAPVGSYAGSLKRAAAQRSPMISISNPASAPANDAGTYPNASDAPTR